MYQVSCRFLAVFYGAIDFNQDIGDWDTSKVVRISYMFFEATAFNRSVTSHSNDGPVWLDVAAHHGDKFAGDLD